MDNSVNIIETKLQNSYKYCLVGVPDVGLVGSIALGYSIQKQDMEEIGYLDSKSFPPVIVVHDGEPKSPFRLYRNKDIVSLISEIPVDQSTINDVANKIVEWAKRKKVQLLIALSGIAVPNRLDLQESEVFGVGSSKKVNDLLKENNMDILQEGFIAGLHAVLMRESQKAGLPCLILLAQSHLQYPDPGAAASIIKTLGMLIGFYVDEEELLNQEEEIRVKMRSLMQRTQQQMREIQKGREQELPSMFV